MVDFKASTPKVVAKKEEVLPDYKKQIAGLISGSINLLNRKISNKLRAIENLQKALSLLKKL